MRRFLAVSAFQLLSMVGTAVTDFAIPIWVYTTTGSLLNFALLVALAIMPGVLAAPLIGALVDRHGKRAMMALGNCLAGGVQLVFGVLLWTGDLATWHIYPLVTLLSITLVFQRLAYTAALPQLVPKRYLGHAAGVVQLLAGTSQFVAPLLAVALLAGIGLGGILVIDVISFAVVLAALALIRFPATMALERRETLAAELAGGFRMSLGNRHLRAALLYFAVLNVMLAAVLMSISPLVLSFADLDTARPHLVRRGPGRHVRRRDRRAVGRAAPPPDARRAARHPAAQPVRRRHRGVRLAADRGPGRVRAVVQPVRGQRRLHDDHPREGAAAVPRPGDGVQPDDLLVDAAGRHGRGRPARGTPAGAAAPARRRAGRHRRRGDRRGPGARHRVHVRPAGPGHRRPGAGGHADPGAGRVRRGGAGGGPGRPGRRAGAAGPGGQRRQPRLECSRLRQGAHHAAQRGQGG
ncbi:MFS transporter [Nonomuraea ferruginea]